ncbi:MAG: LacI family transcriptional regulator [Acholeplasmataceae bacterium]|nr:MAG: LacI family transcriptional regulator [Acholeplasmataceae bacterium]
MSKRTIYTLAKELNLAPGTISKVLNQTGNVSQETRARVLAHIKEVGYVPSTSARMLKSKKTYSVGIVFTEEADVGLEHSFFSSILQHFKTYLEKAGYELSFIVKKLGQHELSYYQWCMNKRVDGVYIVVGNYDDQGLYELVSSNIPCVSTDMMLKGLHTVISDNDQGIRIALEYIRDELKKQRVAMISGPPSSKAFEERLLAYETYMPMMGLERHEGYVVFCESFGFTSGYRAIHDMIKSVSIMPEVILVASDDIALGVLKGLKDIDIRVPDDIQVIGFDDIAFAKHFTPSLTTIAQDQKALGETAAKQLIYLMENGDQEIPEVLKLPVELIRRESTKPAS